MGLVSLHSNPIVIACPKCGVGQGERCRTLTTNRSTDTHEARWLAWFNAKDAAYATNRRSSDG